MPPGATQTPQSYLNLLVKSRLLPPEEAKAAFRKWQDAVKAGLDDDADSLRKFFVSRKHLTDYQSHLLMRGHTEGFFIGGYTVLDLIARGNMAGVYKAVHSSGQVVAVKVLPPSKAKDPTTLARFRREGKLLTKLDHPNVIRAFQVGESDGRHFFVMELLDGEPLDEVLARRKRLPPAEAARVVHQALLGLQHVFERGMVHRDIKPSNLVLVPAPKRGPDETTLGSTVKLIDIGLGRATFDENAPEPDPDSQLTTEGTILGTPDYLAPEQARSAHEVDIRADIYSLGCVLYHLLTGQVPFPDANVLTQIVKHATEEPRPLADFLPQVPDGLQQVLNWMMAKDPNQRYPTPARAATALQIFLQQTPEAAPAAKPLTAYLKSLEVDDEGEKRVPEPKPEPAKVPAGRLERDPDRRDRPAEKKKDGTAPRPKIPAPPVAPPPQDEEYDVEIVAAAPSPPPPKKKPRATGEPRGLFEIDRRDCIMAGIGGGLVLAAILTGYGISRLVRKPPPATTSTEQQQPQPDTTYTPIKTRPAEKKEPPEIKKVPEEKKIEEKKAEEKKEEPKKDDAKKEEMKKEETKKDDAKKDDAKKEDAKKDDTKKE
jgi:serine/threonine protein kinase